MKFITTIILVLLSVFAFSQDKISGKVMNENGEPLQGASVFISSTTIGTITDAGGEFHLTRLPPGNLEVVITFIGYEPLSFIVSQSKRNKSYIFKLRHQAKELAPIILGLHLEENGWKKWGDTFTAGFIGNSAYAKNCTIKNKDILKFFYSDSILSAYASEPLQIENKALGYDITVMLIRFSYDTRTGDVDYRVYSLFKEMEGSDDEIIEWKKNREKVYAFSLMHFMRALYTHNFKNEGYEIQALEDTANTEKVRVQKLFSQYASQVTDAEDNELRKEVELNRLIKNSVGKDSLKYYYKVLLQDDRLVTLNKDPSLFKDIVVKTDSNTVILNFKHSLLVKFKKLKEPQEYFEYKKKKISNQLNYFNKPYFTPTYPVTQLTLLQGIPIEINENGYFNNIDLYLDGFWGWWEKIATKLPYQYEP